MDDVGREPAIPATLRPVTPDLIALANRQGGAVTREQALAGGLDPAQLARLVRTKQLRVVRRQVYALAGERSVRDELLVKASARQLATSGDVVVSHAWAAALHGFTVDVPPVPDLLRPRLAGEPDAVPGLHIARLADSHRTTLGGVPITTPARTLVDCARTLDVEAAIVLADSAIREGCGRAEDELAACRGWPGIEQARTVVAFADGRADSALESRTRWRLHTQGLPKPDLQLTICDEHGRDAGEVDFVWLAQRTILETDGRLKYTDKALWFEKLREDALRALGFEVVRGYWADSAEELARKVRRAFAQSAQYVGRGSFGYRETPRRRAQRLL